MAIPRMLGVARSVEAGISSRSRASAGGAAVCVRVSVFRTGGRERVEIRLVLDSLVQGGDLLLLDESGRRSGPETGKVTYSSHSSSTQAQRRGERTSDTRHTLRSLFVCSHTIAGARLLDDRFVVAAMRGLNTKDPH